VHPTNESQLRELEIQTDEWLKTAEGPSLGMVHGRPRYHKCHHILSNKRQLQKHDFVMAKVSNSTPKQVAHVVGGQALLIDSSTPNSSSKDQRKQKAVAALSGISTP